MCDFHAKKKGCTPSNFDLLTLYFVFSQVNVSLLSICIQIKISTCVPIPMLTLVLCREKNCLLSDRFKAP